MPVRPITESETKLALGLPVTHYLVLMGASQGFLTHLRFNGFAASAKNLMPTPFAKLTLPLFVVGGAALGGGLGVTFFGDAQLRRLFFNHQLDSVARTTSWVYVAEENM